MPPPWNMLESAQFRLMSPPQHSYFNGGPPPDPALINLIVNPAPSCNL
jgi:hypothetical protein